MSFTAELPHNKRMQPTALPVHVGGSKCCQVAFSAKALARSRAAAELAAVGRANTVLFCPARGLESTHERSEQRPSNTSTRTRGGWGESNPRVEVPQIAKGSGAISPIGGI
jgi:hypothetical protein